MNKEIIFLGVGSGICAPTAEKKTGASLGFDSIVEYATVSEKSNLFIRNKRTKRVVGPDDLYEYIHSVGWDEFKKDLEVETHVNGNKSDPNRHARHIKYLKAIFPKIHHEVEKALIDSFPFVIAGDHSTAAATIGALKRHCLSQNKKLGVIWIDAHVDAHSPYSTPSGNMHGMPVGLAFGLKQNLSGENKEIVLDGENNEKHVVELWDSLFVGDYKDVNKEELLLSGEDIFYLGIRSFEKHEMAFLSTYGIEYLHLTRTLPEGEDADLLPKETNNAISVADDKHLRNYSLTDVCKKIEEHFAGHDYLYVSFDIDSLDGSLVPGTGTKVQYGFEVDEVKFILKKIIDSKKLIAMELVEVNPLLDHKNKTAKIAFEIIEYVDKCFTDEQPQHLQGPN